MILIKSEFTSSKLVTNKIKYRNRVSIKTRENFLMKIVNPIIDGIMKQVVQPFLAAVKPILKTFLSFITDALKLLFPELPGAVDKIASVVDTIVDIGKSLFDKVISMFDGVAVKVKQMGSDVIDLVKSFGSSIGDIFTHIWNDIKDTFNIIKTKIHDAYSTVTELMTVPEVFQNFNIQKAFTEIVINIWNMIKSLGSLPVKLFKNIIDTITTVKNSIFHTANSSVDKMESIGSSLMTTTDGRMTNNLNSYITNSESNLTSNWTEFQEVGSSVESKFGNFTSGAKNASGSLVDKIRSVIGGIGHMLKNLFEGIFSVIKNIGEGIINVVKKVNYYGSTYYVIIPLVITIIGSTIYIGHNVTMKVYQLEDERNNLQLIYNERQKSRQITTSSSKLKLLF